MNTDDLDGRATQVLPLTGIVVRRMTGVTLGGRFVVRDELGRGGMGIVYRAHDTLLKTDIAVKVLPDEMSSDPDALEHLVAEVRVAQSLSHPNIVRLHDFHLTAEAAFLTMELIEGPTLVHLLAEHGRLPLDAVMEFVEPLCNGLAYAHSRGVVHRDVKPHNIMLDSDGRLAICDFGIARALDETAMRLTGKRVAGTITYMAPEQYRGLKVDRRADIYAASATVYHLLSGHTPFHTGNVEYQLLNEKPRPIPDVPDRINAALLRGLSKEPSGRFDTIEEFGAALTGEPPGATIRPARADVTAEVGKPLTTDGRRAWRRGLLLTALLFLLIAVAFYWRPLATVLERAVPTALRGGTQSEYGKLYVSSDPPGAMIFLEDDSVGATPLLISRVSTGVHRVRVGHLDYHGVDTVLAVEANRIAKLDRLALTRRTATLNLLSAPLDADVWLDDEKVDGSTPLTIPDVLTGRHNVRLAKAGYHDVRMAIGVHAPVTEVEISFLRADSIFVTPIPRPLNVVLSNRSAGNAVTTDGQDDYVQIPAEALAGLRVFTIAFWMRTTERGYNSTSWRNPTLIGMETSGAPSGDFGIVTRRGMIGLWTGFGETGDQHVVSTRAVNDDTWHHIALVNDGANTTLYLDGDAVASLPSGKSVADHPLYLGASCVQSRTAQFHHSGLVDELSIWRIARSAASLRETMYRPVRGEEEDLIAVWRFDEADEGIVENAGPGRLPARLMNGAQLVASGAMRRP